MGRRRLYSDEERRQRKRQSEMNHYHNNLESSREKRREAARRLRAKKKSERQLARSMSYEIGEPNAPTGHDLSGTKTTVWPGPTSHGSKNFNHVEARRKEEAVRECMKSDAFLYQNPLRDSVPSQVEASVVPPRLFNRSRNNNGKAWEYDGNIEAHERVGLMSPCRSRIATQSEGTSGQDRWTDLPAHSYFMGERLPPSSPPSETDSDCSDICANW